MSFPSRLEIEYVQGIKDESFRGPDRNPIPRPIRLIPPDVAAVEYGSGTRLGTVYFNCDPILRADVNFNTDALLPRLEIQESHVMGLKAGNTVETHRYSYLAVVPKRGLNIYTSEIQGDPREDEWKSFKDENISEADLKRLWAARQTSTLIVHPYVLAAMRKGQEFIDAERSDDRDKIIKMFPEGTLSYLNGDLERCLNEAKNVIRSANETVSAQYYGVFASGWARELARINTAVTDILKKQQVPSTPF